MFISATINELTREIKWDKSQVAAVDGDYAVNGFKLTCLGLDPDYNLTTGTWYAVFTAQDGTSHSNPLTVSGGVVTWEFDNNINKGGAGVIKFFLYAVTANTTGKIIKRWDSAITDLRVAGTIDYENQEEEAARESEIDRLAGLVTTLTATAATINDVKTVISRITNSSPVVVATVADLSGLDTTKYQLAIVRADGYLYYYDGATWQPGIKYGSYELDTTLTESGKAADAAAVGAEVSQIKEDLNDIGDALTGGQITIKPKWRLGVLGAEGSVVKSTNRLITDKAYNLKNAIVNISFPDGYKTWLYTYSSPEMSHNNFVSRESGYRNNAFTFTANEQYYYAFIFAYSDDATITPIDGDKLNVSIETVVDTILDDIDEIKNNLETLKKQAPMEVKWEDGAYIDTSGSTVNTNQSTLNQNWRYCVMPASEGDIFVLTLTGGVSARGWCFIDKSNGVISAAETNVNLIGTKITAPANTAYAVLNDKSMADAESYVTNPLLENISEVNTEIESMQDSFEALTTLIPKDVKTAIFSLLLSSAYINENDRSAEYQPLRDWSLTTPSAKGGIFYHLDETVFDGTNGIITDLVFFDVDRDFTITVDFKVERYYGRRVFGGILNNGEAVNGLALNGFSLNLNGTAHNFAHYGEHKGRVKMVFRHKKGSNVLTIKSLSDYYNIVYDEQFDYTPNADSTAVLVVGKDLRNTIPFFGTIYELTFYAGVWSDTFATAYVKG